MHIYSSWILSLYLSLVFPFPSFLFLCLCLLSSLLLRHTHTLSCVTEMSSAGVKKGQIKTPLGQCHGNCFSSCVSRRKKNTNVKTRMSHEAGSKELENEGTSSFELVNENLAFNVAVLWLTYTSKRFNICIGLCVNTKCQFQFAQSTYCSSINKTNGAKLWAK